MFVIVQECICLWFSYYLATYVIFLLCAKLWKLFALIIYGVVGSLMIASLQIS